MATYYRVNLKNNKGNIIYPNIHHSVNVDKDGIFNNVNGIKMVDAGGSFSNVLRISFLDNSMLDYVMGIRLRTKGTSYINGTTSNAVIQGTQQNTSSFWPMLRAKTADGHYVVLGGINNTFGFWGYYADRTENGTDWYCRVDASSGRITHSGGLTVTGTTTLTGNVTFGAKAIFPTAESWFYSDGNYGINLNNNDIVNVNTIYYSNDVCESSREGIRWKRTDGNYDTFNILDGEAYMFPNIALANTSTTSYKFLTTGNYTTYVVPKSGGTFTGNIHAPEIIGMHRGVNHSITVTGSSSNYYPVVIKLHSSKYVPTYISIWKNLGSTTPDIDGNHSNGTSSLWLIYEGRNVSWDGNGGFVKCWYYYEGYASLCAHAEVAGSAVGNLVVWLRGGTCQYNITTTEGSAPTIYYSTTNIGSTDYPVNVGPRTTIGNAGKYSSKSLGYGNIVGNATTADTADSANSVLVNRALPTSSTYYPVCFLTGSTDETSYKVQANPRASWNFLEGTASTTGYARIQLGNGTAKGTAGNAYGALILYSESTGYSVLQPQSKTGGHTVYLPTVTTYLVGSSGNTVKNLHVVALSTWNSNYSGYANGTIGFCY